jgi:UDP-N-acetylenolpyruvoylglucosamine reductase
MGSVIRQHLMSYINAGSFFENPEKARQELIEEQKARQ